MGRFSSESGADDFREEMREDRRYLESEKSRYGEVDYAPVVVSGSKLIRLSFDSRSIGMLTDDDFILPSFLVSAGSTCMTALTTRFRGTAVSVGKSLSSLIGAQNLIKIPLNS